MITALRCAFGWHRYGVPFVDRGRWRVRCVDCGWLSDGMPVTVR